MLQCEDCGYNCKTKHSFTRHICIKKQDYSKTKIPLERNTQRNFFVDRDAERKSSLNNPNIQSFKCQICLFTVCFSSLDDLTVHMRNRHPIQFAAQNKNLKCDLCDYSTASKSNLESHMVVHSNIKPFKCTFCDYSCKRDYELTHHLRNHTEVIEVKCEL